MMMRMTVAFAAAALWAAAADVELVETNQLPLCHSIGWVSAWAKADPQIQSNGWSGVLDEAKWGVPSAQQAVWRKWDWAITDEQWREAVRQRGEGALEQVRFDLWVPEGAEVVRGVVAISGHGSGEALYRHAQLRALARERRLALFKFVGNPMQRGFWPRSLLDERLRAFGERCGHPELPRAPLFLYGHSNGTGFSALYPAAGGTRVWAWISMRPGTTFQVYQPGAARVPGLVIFGEDDPFLARPSKAENLDVVPQMRKRYGACWAYAVEPKSGHGPGEKTWPLVLSFLRHTFDARVPGDADPRRGPVALRTLAVESGFLGQNWSAAKGGYQELPVASFGRFSGDKSTASWLISADFAADWQAFQRVGEVARSKGAP